MIYFEISNDVSGMIKEEKRNTIAEKGKKDSGEKKKGFRRKEKRIPDKRKKGRQTRPPPFIREYIINCFFYGNYRFRCKLTKIK